MIAPTTAPQPAAPPTGSLAKPAAGALSSIRAGANGRQSEDAANPLQDSQLWRFIKPEYPEWYAQRAKEALSLKANIKDNHAIAG